MWRGQDLNRRPVSKRRFDVPLLLLWRWCRCLLVGRHEGLRERVVESVIGDPQRLSDGKLCPLRNPLRVGAALQRQAIEKKFANLSFLQNVLSEESLSQLAYRKVSRFHIPLWGKSPEIQSIPSTIPRKATAFKHGGTGRGWGECFARSAIYDSLRAPSHPLCGSSLMTFLRSRRGFAKIRAGPLLGGLV